MNLLLDTHIWIWNHLSPWKISSEVNLILADSQNELWLSPVSIWELVMLVEKKRLELDKDMGDWVEQSRRELLLREAPLSWEVADDLRFTKLQQSDPADRFLSYDEFRFALELARSQLLIKQSTQPPGKGIKSKTSWWRR